MLYYFIVIFLESKILECAKDGDVCGVKSHLERFKAESQLDPHTKMKILKVLIKSCAKKNVKAERKEILSYILCEIGDDRIADKCEQSPFHCLVGEKHIPEEEILEELEKVSFELPINSQCDKKKTPIHCAMESNRGKITKYLFESRNFIPDQVDGIGLNYLHYLCIHLKDDDILLTLKASTSNLCSLFKAQCIESKTPLYYAVSEKCKESFLKRLLYDFCSIEDVVGLKCSDKLSPLMKALQEEQTDNALLLVEFLRQKSNGSKVCLNEADIYGNTVLHYCAKIGCSNLFKKLCELFQANDDVDSIKELLRQQNNKKESPWRVIISERKIDILCTIEGDILLLLLLLLSSARGKTLGKKALFKFFS